MILFLIIIPLVLANVTLVENGAEDSRINLLIDLIGFNLKSNGWNNIISYGRLPDAYYSKLNVFPFTFVTSNSDEDDYYLEDVIKYNSNTIVINCFNFTDFEDNLRQAMVLPYWHPLANVIILYSEATEREIATIFYILWYYRISNAILIQFEDKENVALISQFNSFVVNNGTQYGCRTVKKIEFPINSFDEGFVCEENCQNITFSSRYRILHYGFCIEFKTHRIRYDDRHELTKLNLFEDKGKDMNGFAFRTYATEVLPFIKITKIDNGSYAIDARDGIIWNTLAELMNFTIDLSPSADEIEEFNFETSIKHIFTVSHRKGDLFLLPIYQFHIVILDLDYSFAYKESGVCFLSHRAAYETVLFDLKTLQDNFDMVIQFAVCVSCIWVVFFLYSAMENKVTVDLIGKNFMNTIRSTLSLSLFNPPKRQSFRIFLGILLWSFFVINFSTQAAIISFFTAFKRGKEVETFADIVAKGYKVQGMASPDLVLPDENEHFRIINSRLEPIPDIYGCVKAMTNNGSDRICLIDCSVGRYIQSNMLNSKGEQYMHIAVDRVHNYYLNLVFQKHSVMTDSVNKYLMIFYEAGLVRKWEEYRFNDIKDDAPVRPLGMEEFIGIFQAYFFVVLITIVIFSLELIIGNFKRVRQYWSLKVISWRNTRKERKVAKLERKQNINS